MTHPNLPPVDRRDYDRAVVLFELGRWRECINAFGRHLEKYPDDSDALAMSAGAWINTKADYAPRARTLADDALRIAPNSAYCLYIRSIVAQHVTPDRPPPGMGNRDWNERRFDPTLRLLEAKRYAMAALQSDPRHLPSWRQLATIARALGDAASVRQAIDQALALHPADVMMLRVRAEYEHSHGASLNALRTLNDALAIDAENEYTHTLRGWQMLQRGDARTALAHFQSALQRRPTLRSAGIGAEHSRWACRIPPYRWAVRFWLWGAAGHDRQLAQAMKILCSFALVLAVGSMADAEATFRHFCAWAIACLPLAAAALVLWWRYLAWLRHKLEP